MNASVRLSLTSLRAHKRRFAGTFSAVLLGVAFLAGTLVMGDTLRASFDSMFAGASSGTDAVVRSGNVITTPGESQGTRRPVAASLADDLAKVPGVAAAAPNIQGAGQLVDAHGKPIGGQGPPPSPETGSTTPSSTRTSSPTAVLRARAARSSSTAAPRRPAI